MIEPAHFAALVDKAMILSGRGHMRPVIEKELLHYDILFSLDKEGLLDILTFQGGTSLRLCYGAPRFSPLCQGSCRLIIRRGRDGLRC
ncbi:nucleotidyl transferase AbiEii/AbiGii toxin family protein [Desulfoplanes sp. PS50]|jgi:hypothetical protein